MSEDDSDWKIDYVDQDFPVVGHPTRRSVRARGQWSGRSWQPAEFLELIREREPLLDDLPETVQSDRYRRHEAWRKTAFGSSRATYFFAPADMSEADAFALAKKRKLV